MKSPFHPVSGGSLTSPREFLAGATSAGIKSRNTGALDLGVLFSTRSCTAAGVFTTNKVKAAPVLLSQQRVATGTAQAITVNSGCANACTGARGMEDATAMASYAADRLGIAPEAVLVASTGLIGAPLPMEKVRQALANIQLSPDNGHLLAKAIMTTDTFPKETALSFDLGGKQVTIGGAAKGAGMIHPNMATLLSFISTDAALDPAFARSCLKRAADATFNMISVDGDTSTNDTLVLLANGAAGNTPIRSGTAHARLFEAALTEVCLYLAKCIARDGEGATRLMEIRVEGAASRRDAVKAARTIATSPLVKAALHGGDPNWGRILAAAGRSGAQIDPQRTDLYLGDICLMSGGCPAPFDRAAASGVLRYSREVAFRLCLNVGKSAVTAWGCDLSREYVAINSDYST